MAHWLVKSEPETFSWDDLVKAGAKGEPWTGVRNHAAKLHLMAMKKGDGVFYYHSGGDRQIVGLAEVTKAAYPDPTAAEGPWVCVDLKAAAPMKTPVTLDQVKKTAKLKDMALVKLSRLSVQPVTDEQWALVCKMGGVKA